jgi:sirohydrochlorin cobaltochelatase
MTTGILIVGHGSRDLGANAELESFVATVRARRAEEIAHAYVELAEPAIPEGLDALARRCDRVIAAPLLLFAAGHVKNDLPLALERARKAHPRVSFSAARALGVDASLVELVAERIGAADPETAVVVVGRGSSDPDANGDFCKLVRLVGERTRTQASPAFMGITTPKVEQALEQAARTRPRRIVVVPYLLVAGRLIERLDATLAAAKARTPWIAIDRTAHLGDDPRVHAALDARIDEARTGSAPLPCDTCQYRVPLGPVAELGGLRALLWSVRHGVTHTQSAPHLHAHRPIKKHVLVCGNADCASRGSVGVVIALRRKLRDAGAEASIKITRTSCMGRCGEGPTVAVYPDGVFYRGVTATDADDLVRDHLLGDRLVSRLVDHVLQ